MLKHFIKKDIKSRYYATPFVGSIAYLNMRVVIFIYYEKIWFCTVDIYWLGKRNDLQKT